MAAANLPFRSAHLVPRLEMAVLTVHHSLLTLHSCFAIEMLTENQGHAHITITSLEMESQKRRVAGTRKNSEDGAVLGILVVTRSPDRVTTTTEGLHHTGAGTGRPSVTHAARSGDRATSTHKVVS